MKPAPEFLFAKSMSAGSRLALVAFLAALGLALQLFASVFLGWLLIFAAVMLGATAWRSNEPHVTAAGEWRNVTTAEIEEARKLISSAANVKGANAPFYLGSVTGCGLLVLLIVGTLFVGAMLGSAVDRGTSEPSLGPVLQGGSVSLIFIIDSLTLLLPMWIFGWVRTWQPPNLEMRLDQMWHIYSKTSSDPKLDFQPSLQVAKCKDGSVPMDCRLMVKLKDSDPNFMGIQIQTSLNDVQGRKFPYTYCVLIAKPEFSLVDKAKNIVEMPPTGGFTVGFLGLFADANEKKEAKFPRYQGAVVEIKKEGDVEIAVVRQGTGGRGYTTSPEQAYQVFSVAYALARKVLGA